VSFISVSIEWSTLPSSKHGYEFCEEFLILRAADDEHIYGRPSQISICMTRVSTFLRWWKGCHTDTFGFGDDVRLCRRWCIRVSDGRSDVGRANLQIGKTKESIDAFAANFRVDLWLNKWTNTMTLNIQMASEIPDTFKATFCYLLSKWVIIW